VDLCKGAKLAAAANPKSLVNLNLGGVQFPGGMAVDTAGNIDITDQNASAIDAFAPGQFGAPLFTVPIAGGKDRYPKGSTATNTLIGLLEPTGVAITPRGGFRRLRYRAGEGAPPRSGAGESRPADAVRHDTDHRPRTALNLDPRTGVW
jgi:hypothetical protein